MGRSLYPIPDSTEPRDEEVRPRPPQCGWFWESWIVVFIIGLASMVVGGFMLGVGMASTYVTFMALTGRFR